MFRLILALPYTTEFKSSLYLVDWLLSALSTVAKETSFVLVKCDELGERERESQSLQGPKNCSGPTDPPDQPLDKPFKSYYKEMTTF